jgi:hypothetical protein
MKTAKTEGVTRPKKSTAKNIAVMARKEIIKGHEPTEDEIRDKAQAIYLERLEKGEDGTAIDDWFKAEKILKYSSR